MALTRSKKKKAAQLLQRQQLPQAKEAYERICELDPHDYEAWLNLGAINAMMGQLDKAEYALRKVLVLRNDLPQAQFNLAYLLRDQGRLQEALPFFLAYTKLKPCASEIYIELGRIYQALSQLPDARIAYEKALSLGLDTADIHNNLAVVLQDLNFISYAVLHYEKALRLDAQRDDVLANLGNCHFQNQAIDEAQSCYQKALLLNPENAATYLSLGHLHASLGHYDDALHCFDKSIQLRPDYAGARWNRALVLLVQGQFYAGWYDYEWRFQCPEVVQQIAHHPFDKSSWDKPLAMFKNKTVVVSAEQGLGDTLQFCRYLPLLVEQGIKVLFECQLRLVRLLASLDDRVMLVTQEEGKPPTQGDFHIPLMSLPRIFSTELESIPANTPYLHVSDGLRNKWCQRLANDACFKVGLVWGGNPNNPLDRLRSIPLSLLVPLAAVREVSFYSLQMGSAIEQLAHVPEFVNMLDLSNEQADFADTAACIEQLDLVISVDTAVAHLAGALGRPIWTLIQSPPDWRWLLDRDDSPWYPSMRLFRQSKAQQWESVVDQLVAELRLLITSQP